MGAPYELELETRALARPETVFAFLTDPTLYRRWQGHAAELDPRAGGLFRVRMPGQATVEGTYLVVQPLRRIVFTWGWVGNADVPPGSTTVEVTLTPDGDETVVRLVHQGLPTELSRADHTEGWRLYLGRLRVAAGGGDPGPNPVAAAVM
jgi:uncharacterized protein YndB with AHSA1/START domain